MSAKNEKTCNELLAGVVPTEWKQFSYLSEKSLVSYVSDLCARLNFIEDWIANGPPKVVWISGLFLPRNFLLGM
jgi:dynein heavy chain